MLITFEGIDGSGKSTQIERLEKRLQGGGYQVEVYREPGGTDLSEKVRSLLLDKKNLIDPRTELLLFSAARSQLISERVKPGLEEGKIIILDRYYDSTIAYQGYGRQAGNMKDIHAINHLASHGLVPDITFYLHIDLGKALQRTDSKPKDRMEASGEEFYNKVIEGFKALEAGEDRFKMLDAELSPDSIHSKIWDMISAQLSHS